MLLSLEQFRHQETQLEARDFLVHLRETGGGVPTAIGGIIIDYLAQTDIDEVLIQIESVLADEEFGLLMSMLVHGDDNLRDTVTPIALNESLKRRFNEGLVTTASTLLHSLAFMGLVDIPRSVPRNSL